MTEPTPTALDPTALADLRARVRREVDDGLTPAAQIALARDGQLLEFEAFGTADAATRFNIFSCTKAFIAGVVWQLIAEGTLTPSTRVVDLVPRFGSEGTSADQVGAITLEHLLTHTAGFPHAPLGPPRWDTRHGRLDAMARWRLTFEPGTQYEYHASSAHWVVAEMIEVVEGRDYRQVVHDRIAAPLGLPSFELGVAPDDGVDIAELVAVGSAPSADELMEIFGVSELPMGEVTPEALLMFNEPAVRAVGVPGGGGIATAADLALYYQALLHDPGRLWDPAVLADGTGNVRCTFPDLMTGVPANRTLGVTVAGGDGKAAWRGMGHTVGPRTFGHNGAAGQIAWADPDSGLSFAFTTAGIDRNVLREARRSVGIASRAGRCVVPT